MSLETSTPIMEYSTPTRNNDLRRRTLMQVTGITSSAASPLRRTSAIPLPTVQTETNDESERLSRRSILDMQRRLSNLPQPHSPLNESTKFLGEQDMKDHFQVCTKLYSENKINTKNAWQLHIIDLLRHLSQKQTGDNLQVASTSLDISAKVYGIRVDDIYTDGLKLASNMARASEKQAPARGEGDMDDEQDAPEGAENEKAVAKKKRKKKFLTSGEKNTISKDPKTLTSSLPKLESVFFSTRTNAEASSIDNLFTNVLKMDNTGYKFMILSKERAWADKPDPLITNFKDEKRKKHSFTVNAVKNFKICPAFSDFHLDEWDPEEEEKQLAAEKSALNTEKSLVNEVVFDDNGIPIPELDGSIHDIFTNDNDDDDNMNNDDIMEEQEFCAQIQGDVEQIVDFQPEQLSQRSEYSYNSVVSTHCGKYLDQIWAGPSHWKLKCIRRTTARFSGQATQTSEKGAPKQTAKKRKEVAMIEFADDEEFVEFDFTKKLNEKKKMKMTDPQKITLPEYDNSCEDLFRPELVSKCVIPRRKSKSAENRNPEVDYGVGEYNYENPNDSLYCAQQSPNDDGEMMDNDDNGGDFDDNEREEIMAVAARQNFLAENLVDCPESVPKSYVPYALQAKKMDMKKLKAAVWQNLIQSADKLDKDTKKRSGKVVPTTFSKIYEEIPKLISEKMRNELSPSLAFVALLHLCNEQNLELRQQPDFQDFEVLGPIKELNASLNGSRMDWM